MIHTSSLLYTSGKRDLKLVLPGADTRYGIGEGPETYGQTVGGSAVRVLLVDAGCGRGKHKLVAWSLGVTPGVEAMIRILTLGP